MKRIRFIGGPMCGEIMDVEEVQMAMVIRMADMPPPNLEDFSEINASVSYKDFVYNIHHIAGGSIWAAPEGWTFTDAIEHLWDDVIATRDEEVRH